MKRVRDFFIMAILVALAGSCKHKAARPFLEGEYLCIGYNQAHEPVVKGRLSITELTEGHFNGEWHLKKISDTEEHIEYVYGDGRLAGTVDQKYVEINFNPGWSDNNYILNAAIDGERLVGMLRFSGFAGGPDLGRFEATRVSTP